MQTPPNSPLVEHLLKNFLWVSEVGEADPDEKPCSYKMKLWVHISEPLLSSGTQQHCSGFENLPNLRSLPAMTGNPPLLPCLLMGLSVCVACITVTGSTQQRARASHCLQWFATHIQNRGQHVDSPHAQGAHGSKPKNLT